MIARSTVFKIGFLLATAISVSTLSNAAKAYTPEEEQACTGDAFRLCSSEIPDVDRVTACMVRLRSQLSPGCRAFFRDTAPVATPVAARKPLQIKPRKAGKTAKTAKSGKPVKPKKPKAT
jgi:hypothetical protein